MPSTRPVESFGEAVERFPGIDNLEPTALGRFAFHAARHSPPDDFLKTIPGEEKAEWHDEVQDVLMRVREWRAGYSQTGTIPSRAELAQSIANEADARQQSWNVKVILKSASADEGLTFVTGLLEQGEYFIQSELASSPLFPDGRTAREPWTAAQNPETREITIPYGTKLVGGKSYEVTSQIQRYLDDVYPNKKATETIRQVVANIEPIDIDHFENLRAGYGAKAAGLLTYKEKTDQINAQLDKTSNSVELDIPPFVAVNVAMYEAWLAGDKDAFEKMLDKVNERAVGLDSGSIFSKSQGLVAIRSSAVKSEDGDEHTGAGVYKSVAVDPKDKDAFRKAVEEVYASARSESALSYQRSIGVTDEIMGLVIQQYLETIGRDSGREENFYGHANSAGANPNMIDLHTQLGDLIYDRAAVAANLLMKDGSNRRESTYLHTHPDHSSDISWAISKTDSIPHAVLIAEQLFGKPMQIEFVNKSIVQVRPIKVESSGQMIDFPEDLDPIAECSAVGVGDVELDRLDPDDDNSGKTGFITFWREYAFTMTRNHAGYDAFPKEGAVLIMNPSSSGHIQAICREKGLLCLFPKQGESIEHVDDAIREEIDAGDTKVRLRFVADGYKAKIYSANETKEVS